jgi:hypothetical protein
MKLDRLEKTRPTPSGADVIHMAIALLLFIAAASAWHLYWVEPRDKAMRLTADCLSNKGLEMNEGNWNQCWKIVTDNLRRAE